MLDKKLGENPQTRDDLSKMLDFCLGYLTF